MTPSNTHPGTMARSPRRTSLLEVAHSLLTARARRPADRVRTRPRLEGLEDRCLLSTTITEFPVPTAVSNPEGITAGPDGNLWFTELGPQLTQRNKITFPQGDVGVINPATHVITEYPVPTANSRPDGITTGPDG